MMKALFLDSSLTFVSALREGPFLDALMTTSPNEALGWIEDASVPLSAIYLNPSNPNLSGLQFLSRVSACRPATPLFILNRDGDFNSQNFSNLSDKFKLQGMFSGEAAAGDLIKTLEREIPLELQGLNKKHEKANPHPGYFPIAIQDFLYLKTYNSNVFMEDGNNLRFFAMEGSEVDLEYLAFLSKKTAWLYCEKASIESRLAAISFIEASYLDPEYLPASWRTAETFYRAKLLLNEFRKNGVSESLVSETYHILEDVFKLTAQMNDEASLQKLILRAKECDRSLACVTLSVLLCRKLKFEKNAIVQTLGFASLLQDISLFRTPFGDLSTVKISEMNPQALAYFWNHPNLSADCLTKLGDVPDVTTQIIRQQHERPDRTGYPAKVGSANLQPLAEILSVINSYLDSEGQNDDYLDHYSDRVVIPFRQLLHKSKF